MARAEPPRLDREPAIGLLFLIPFEDEVAVLPRVEVPELGEPLFHLLEEVQDRVAVVGQLHLGIEVDVDVKIVGVATIAIHPRGPEIIATTPDSQPGRSESEWPRSSGPASMGSGKGAILPQPDPPRNELTGRVGPSTPADRKLRPDSRIDLVIGAAFAIGDSP